jgi:hypothetical protein
MGDMGAMEESHGKKCTHNRNTKKSATHGVRGEKRLKKGGNVTHFHTIWQGQRLMCVFKELARSPKLGGVTLLQRFLTVLKTSKNRTKISLGLKLGVPLGFAVTQRGGRGPYRTVALDSVDW